MRGLLEQHANLASFMILFFEDLGIPMPVPADMVIMYAGYRAHEHLVHPVWIVLLLLTAVNLASTILYFVIRRGGRPIVERFGRYLHLDQARLARAESWVRDRGVLGIIISRSIPGVRIATVIACGLFRIRFPIFIVAQVLGTFLYLMFFFLIGYYLGPRAVEHVHLPAHALRLLLMLVVALGLPLLLGRLNRRTWNDDTRLIQAGLSARQCGMAALLSGFAGMVEAALLWGALSSLARVMHWTGIQQAVRTLAYGLTALSAGGTSADDVTGRPHGVALAYVLDYVAMLLLCLVAALFFFQVLMPRLRIEPRKLGQQVLYLWLFVVVAVGGTITLDVLQKFTRQPGYEALWLSPAGQAVGGGILLGLLGYAYVAVETRRLAIDRFSG